MRCRAGARTVFEVLGRALATLTMPDRALATLTMPGRVYHSLEVPGRVYHSLEVPGRHNPGMCRAGITQGCAGQAIPQGCT